MKHRSTVVPFPTNLLLSVKPRFAEKIIAGEKSIELRRRLPVQLAPGGIAVIYASSPMMQIIGFARVDDLITCEVESLWTEYATFACVNRIYFDAYFEGLRRGFALQLSQPVKLQQAISLNTMRDRFGISPPQSYRYLPDALADYILSQSVNMNAD